MALPGEAPGTESPIDWAAFFGRVAPVELEIGSGRGRFLTDAAAERLVAGELAAPRATGKLLAGLPLLGIAMGYLTGGDPVDFLINQPLGRIALAAAICLVCAGLVWTTLLGSAPVEVAE